MKKNKNIILPTLLVYAIVSMIIGSFYDLDINKLVYMRGSLFPNFFKFTGEMPMIILISTAAFTYIKYGYKTKNKILLAIMAIIGLGFPIGSSFTTVGYFGTTNIIASFLVAIFYFMTILFIVANIKVKEKYKDKVMDYCIFVIVSIIAIFLTFTLMKPVWGRLRFFPMHQNNDYSGFTNWWVITNNSGPDIYKSFPSGHTGSAATTLVMIFIPVVFANIHSIQKYKKYFYIFPVVWTILVQVSRLLDGAHYLTDVSASIIISVVILSITKKLFLDKHLKNNKA